MLKKATEYGAVEIWMNERVRRACTSSCADFLYGFLEVLCRDSVDDHVFFTLDRVVKIDCYDNCCMFLLRANPKGEEEANTG